MFQPFGLSEQVPALGWIVRSLLTAERSQCAITGRVFHCYLPGFAAEAYSLSLRQSHYGYATELILDPAGSRTSELDLGTGLGNRTSIPGRRGNNCRVGCRLAALSVATRATPAAFRSCSHVLAFDVVFRD